MRRAKVWSGWRVWTPMVIGVAQFVVLTPGMFGGFVVARLVIGAWMLMLVVAPEAVPTAPLVVVLALAGMLDGAAARLGLALVPAIFIGILAGRRSPTGSTSRACAPSCRLRRGGGALRARAGDPQLSLREADILSPR